ncbi:hypothetical protein ACS0TY_004509 [Phlomoides rotata]
MDAQVAFSDLYGYGKLDGHKYAMWHRKIQFLLHHKYILDHITTALDMPFEHENGQNVQYRHDLDAYNKCVSQDNSVRYSMLSCILAYTYWYKDKQGKDIQIALNTDRVSLKSGSRVTTHHHLELCGKIKDVGPSTKKKKVTYRTHRKSREKEDAMSSASTIKGELEFH